MTINERLQLIVNQLFNGNKSAFAKTVNVVPTTLYSCLRSENPSIPSGEILGNIVNSIGDLDAEWLLTGKGDMLKNSHIGHTTNGDYSPITGNIEIHNCIQELEKSVLRVEYLEKMLKDKEMIIELLTPKK